MTKDDVRRRFVPGTLPAGLAYPAFGLLPEGLFVVQRESLEAQAPLGGDALHGLKASLEAGGRGANGRLGIGLEPAAGIDEREEQVADLGLPLSSVFGAGELAGSAAAAYAREGGIGAGRARISFAAWSSIIEGN